MTKSKDKASSLSQQDIASFTTKLSEWSAGLPDSQKAIAQILVERARDLSPETVALSRITSDLRASAREVIKALNLDILGPSAGTWVRIDPVWERKNKIELGEDIEILQRLFVNVKR